jgi:hypothetical protein
MMTTDLTQPDDTVLGIKTEALLAELGRVAENKSRLSRWSRPLIWFYLFYIFGYGILISPLHLPVLAAYTAIMERLFSITVLGAPLAIMPEFLFWKRAKKSRERTEMLVRELITDSRAVGALAQLCRSTQVLSGAGITLRPLLKLLPDVKAGDARYISDSQMEALLDLIVVRIQDRLVARCTELPLAVLKALEQVGDRRSIEPVRRLTTGRSNARYHQAAQECLAVLEQHGEERDHNRFLLLPSSVEVGKETLLRPTIPQAELQPELLLRATTEKERG